MRPPVRLPLPWWRRRKGRGAVVVPRPLTLGVYLDAHAHAGVDDGAAWDAAAAPLEDCLAVLAVLADVTLPPGADLRAEVRRLAGGAWAGMVAGRERAVRMADALRLRVEDAVGEGLQAAGGPRALALERDLSRLPPAEYAAALSLPLFRALAHGAVGAVVRQASEAEEKALESARLN